MFVVAVEAAVVGIGLLLVVGDMGHHSVGTPALRAAFEVLLVSSQGCAVTHFSNVWHVDLGDGRTVLHFHHAFFSGFVVGVK